MNTPLVQTPTGKATASVVVILNKFSGRCRVCGKPVPALSGLAIKEGSCKWQAAHYECESVLAAPLLKEREEKRAAYKAEQEAKEAFKRAVAARRDELLEKTGLDLTSGQVISSACGAWNDSFTTAYSFSGEGSLSDFKELLDTPAESSYGKLRWSNGRRVTKVEGNKVFVYESVGLCD